MQAYLENSGRKQSLEDWQHYQIVDAIQNLLELIEVDWGFWNNSARSFSPDHPIIACDVSTTKSDQMSYKSKDGNTASASSQHTAVIIKLINEIRRRGYSIRTKQAYGDWAVRFIAFSGNQNPKKLGARIRRV